MLGLILASKAFQSVAAAGLGLTSIDIRGNEFSAAVSVVK